MSEAVPGKLKPGSWTARIHDMAERDAIPPEMAPLLIRDYINPSRDTTISATGQLFYQLGRNPAQWDRIRADPALISGAVNEAVRLGSPIRTFSRTLTRDSLIGGVGVPMGSRVMMLFGSANRDERQFPDPDRFDPARPAADHVGFGHGIHQCVGMHLARLEMESLLKAMIGRVDAFVVGEPRVALNSFATLPMRLMRGAPAAERPLIAPTVERDGWRDVRIADRQVQAEGIVSFKQTLAGFLIYLTDIHALTPEVVQGFTFVSGFYWNQNETARVFSKRFMATQRAMPTRAQAAGYAGCMHFLKAMQQAGTRAAIAVNKAMRAMPIDYFGHAGPIRADGRALYEITSYRVKAPGKVTTPWDYYDALGTIAAADAFLPIDPSCAA